MRLLLDTNILFAFSKDSTFQLFERVIGPEIERIFVSVVSVGELRSIAIQNNWGAKRIRTIDMLITRVIVIEVNESMIDTYAQIDSFSQCKNPHHRSDFFSTPRNMGKNDLWIASTAALLGLKLITTDNDFSHLHDVFIEVECLKPEQLKS